jgi:HPt (histidine-containing phosphotransfer) domain-containing protein
MAELIDAEQIGMLVEGAGAEAVRPILDAYWQSNDELILQLRLGIEAGSPETIATTAHALKGSSGNLGAVLVARRAQTIEIAAKAGNLGDVRALFDKLPEDIEATRNAFEQVLAERG